MRTCPQCKQEMRKTRVAAIQVDECPGCKGLWLDDEEQALAKEEARPDLAWLDLELWKHREHFHASARRLRCPDCAKELVGIEYGPARVVIDACPDCRGIWLDKGEFQRVLDALLAETAHLDVGDYLRETLEEARELFSGDESFLTEWRDLRAVLKLLQLRFFVEHPRLRSLVSGMPPF